MASLDYKLNLFDGFGLEIEYMIVEKKTLAVQPVADRLFELATGAVCSDVSNGEIAWSNELVAHVVELKNPVPVNNLAELPARFQKNVEEINQLLNGLGSCLLPTAMHPLMVPEESKLWQHDNMDIYSLYNSIFNCRGHGWSNLQSTHLNLPFADDNQFDRLHTAVRCLLPLLPALTASSPLCEGRFSGTLDTRLWFYKNNQLRVPVIAGDVIPDYITSRKQYQENVLAPIYAAISPFDPEQLLQYEWLNSRGVIAKFSRNSIEIRILDVQECPLADCALAALIVNVLKDLVSERLIPYAIQKSFNTKELAQIYNDVVRLADQAVITNYKYTSAFGLAAGSSARDCWVSLYDRTRLCDSIDFVPAIEIVLNEGCLSSRILRSLPKHFERSDILKVYTALASGLHAGASFKSPKEQFLANAQAPTTHVNV